MDVSGVDAQAVVTNIVFPLVTAVFGYWIKSLNDSLKDLKQTDSKLAEKLGSIEVLIAGSYVTNSEYKSMVKAFFHKLDSIQDDIKTLIKDKADK